MAKEKTKSDLKRIAMAALEANYGFSPMMSKIELAEANDNGTRIAFYVGRHYYEFYSHLIVYNTEKGQVETVWVGEGTIEKLTQFDKVDATLRRPQDEDGHFDAVNKQWIR